MSLTKKDLQQISKIINFAVDKSSRFAVEEFYNISKRFDQVDKKFDKVDERLKSLEKNQIMHDFKMTELVHKADYFKLEERVRKLELKFKKTS